MIHPRLLRSLAFGVAAVALLLLFSCGNCGEKRREAPTAEESERRASADSRKSAAAPALPLFVEVVYEVSAYPLKGLPVHRPDRPEQLNGFILEEGPSGLSLFPAMGVEPDQAEVPQLWVGFRLVDRIPHYPRHFQWLEGSHGTSTKLATGALPAREDLLAAGGLFAVLREPLELGLERRGTGEIQVAVAGTSRTLERGEWTELFLDEKRYTRDELFEAVVEAFGKSGVNRTALDEEGLRDLIRVRFPAGESRVLHLRISALLHGEVEVAPFDVRSQWRRARRLSEEGPYPQAMEALERVLLAVPSHEDALERWSALQRLLAEGAEPAFILGTLKFPGGSPNKRQRELWQKYHAGIAAVADPGAPEDSALATAPVEEGRFRLSVPGGTYRLSVSVPGFEIAEQTLEVKGRTEIDVELVGP